MLLGTYNCNFNYLYGGGINSIELKSYLPLQFWDEQSEDT